MKSGTSERKRREARDWEFCQGEVKLDSVLSIATLEKSAVVSGVLICEGLRKKPGLAIACHPECSFYSREQILSPHLTFLVPRYCTVLLVVENATEKALHRYYV
eukprot:scaffold44518_cov237-Amphora_coffeaeformis.AAC.1